MRKRPNIKIHFRTLSRYDKSQSQSQSATIKLSRPGLPHSRE